MLPFTPREKIYSLKGTYMAQGQLQMGGRGRESEVGSRKRERKVRTSPREYGMGRRNNRELTSSGALALPCALGSILLSLFVLGSTSHFHSPISRVSKSAQHLSAYFLSSFALLLCRSMLRFAILWPDAISTLPISCVGYKSAMLSNSWYCAMTLTGASGNGGQPMTTLRKKMGTMT
ncbi:hypothetical protein QBC32DRAFT_10133 [Pseudoneurospora amorphoporcata]|uniref:Uncharacterized protein n=1 Tax=Pseudoneurospora amorphoporcata TaxID=241081 RepID=A0AAN6SJH2_9PEZI|nr:hypothetical protein QBC32DRAFT_10133 [Pseudoneurospora amorphoporcata]